MVQFGFEGFRNEEVEQIRRDHGQDTIAALRKAYGTYFAPGIAGHHKVGDVLHLMNPISIEKLLGEVRC